MLVLTRKRNQSIVIDGKIRIMIVVVKGGAVRLGIEAPSNMNVIREELIGGQGKTAKVAEKGSATKNPTEEKRRKGDKASSRAVDSSSPRTQRGIPIKRKAD